MRRQKRQPLKKPLDTMLTTGEVARIFNVSPGTIRRWSERGIIKANRIGPSGRRQFSREAVALAYLDMSISHLLKSIKRTTR